MSRAGLSILRALWHVTCRGRCTYAGDRLRHLKYCEPYPQRQFSWVLVHYPGRVDAMTLREFKEMSGISETPYPNAFGPVVDAVVRQIFGSLGFLIFSRNSAKTLYFFLLTGLPKAVWASHSH